MHLLLTILSLLPLSSKIPKAFSRSALKFVPVKYNTLQICISMQLVEMIMNLTQCMYTYVNNTYSYILFWKQGTI